MTLTCSSKTGVVKGTSGASVALGLAFIKPSHQSRWRLSTISSLWISASSALLVLRQSDWLYRYRLTRTPTSENSPAISATYSAISIRMRPFTAIMLPYRSRWFTLTFQRGGIHESQACLDSDRRAAFLRGLCRRATETGAGGAAGSYQNR